MLFGNIFANHFITCKQNLSFLILNIIDIERVEITQSVEDYLLLYKILDSILAHREIY